MNILFISYWPLNDGLTVSTAFPHLKVLESMEVVDKVVLATMERNTKAEPDFSVFNSTFPGSKIKCVPVYSKNAKPYFLNKFIDFIYIPKKLEKIIRENKIEKIIARGSLAGALANAVWRRSKTPFMVESFEPHSEYMLESKVWHKYDPRFLFQSYWEKQEKKNASYLLPVAHNYKVQLLKEGLSPDKIFTVPVAVNEELFAYSETDRIETRRRLSIAPETFVGIYVGKFGGTYYDRESFHVFKEAFTFYGDKFRLIILSPDDKESIIAKLRERKVPLDRVTILSVKHAEVPAFLSASDFAFNLVRPAPSKRHCSPTKDGEYWANGLPVLLTKDIGDDSDIIKQEDSGAVFDLDIEGDLPRAFAKLEEIISRKSHRAEISKLAGKHRSVANIIPAYKAFLE